ncbi:MAG: glutamine--tRNA ligase/YqeY domain fusion protein [bacterium]
MHTPETPVPSDFIRDIISEDLASGKHSRVVTRFPPEPNGYLHIGHAKAICIDFGTALEFGGECHLRMDDTNPSKETMEYVESIKNDVRWLGFDWGEHFYFSADYFERMYDCTCALIRKGGAYVCELTQEQWKDYRGIPTQPGKESPFRNRPAEESLDLFNRMRAGEFQDGTLCVRAKIDMSSPNLHMRDPVIYRIMRAHHYRTGDKWCIYPTYDFAHPIEDAIEYVTHSLCTLEFEVHRPLYDWVLQQLHMNPTPPRQIEFARLNLTYTVLSKRKLLELVRDGHVKGWDDPRMPTVAGLRRRGFTAESIRHFCKRIGVTKFDGYTDIALLEFCVREELNQSANRAMAVLDPIKVVIDNFPADQVDFLEGINNPENPDAGVRIIPFTRELYIERDDFREESSKKYYRLAPGQEVRLRYSYFITCTGFTKDPVTGLVTEIRCTYDPATRGGNAPDGRKVKGTIHWVSASEGILAEIRIYDRLFKDEHPEEVPEGMDYKTNLNPDSLKIVKAVVEPALAKATPGTRFQFERKGYFIADSQDHRDSYPVFNQIVPLKDSGLKAAGGTK